MNVQHRVPLLVRVVCDARVPDVARVVDEDVEVTEALEAASDRVIAELLLGHVSRERLAGSSEPGDVGSEALQAASIQIVGEDTAPFRGQLEHERATDPLSRPGDERHTAVEPPRAHRALAFHSSIPSIMMPLAAFGWTNHRPCAPDPTGGRSMIGRDRSSSFFPLAATSSVTTARW